MTLEQLRMLKIVAEHGTLKSASEVLHKTQPALSQGIRQLESQLGLQLFSRTGYRLALTSDGRQIYQLALNVLKESAQLKQVAKHLAQGHEARITLAFEASYALSALLPVLEQTQQIYPDTQIILRQEFMSGAFEAVAGLQADLAISAVEWRTAEDPQFELLPLQKGTLINVAAAKLLARHDGLTHVSQLREEYQIVVQDSGQATKDKEFGVQSGQRRWYVNDFATKKTLIESGMGWGKLPLSLVEDELRRGELRELALEGINSQVTLDYFAIRQAEQVAGPVASYLWRQLSELSRRLSSGQRGQRGQR